MPPTPMSPPSAPSPPKDGQSAPARFRDRVRERTGMQDLLVVCIGDERFAVPLDAVDELVEAPVVRRVPGAPAGLLGLFTLGDATLPLYSPAGILGIDAHGEQVALVMRGGRARLALAVDDADEVLSVSLGDVRDAPRTGHHDDVVLGVIWHDGQLLTLLDARAVVASYAALSTEAS